MDPLTLIALAFIGAVGFFFGYDTADSKERKARAKLNEWHNNQYRALSQFVQKNWPDRYAAYCAGRTEGYQQGILHAPDLEQDE